MMTGLREHGVDKSFDPEPNEFVGQLLTALRERLPAVDLGRLLEVYPTVEAAADRMMEAVPNVFVSEPLLGPCYTTAALARWRGVSRQAIHRLQKTGRLFAVKHRGVLVFPSCQFDPWARVRPAFLQILADLDLRELAPGDIAVRLQTADSVTGLSPAAILAGAERDMSQRDRTIAGFVPTVVSAPLGTGGDIGGTEPTAILYLGDE